MRENMIETIDKLVIKLDKDKMNDMAFIDEQDEDHHNFKMIKTSLIKCNTEAEFLHEIDAQIQDQVKAAKKALRDQHKIDMDDLNT